MASLIPGYEYDIFISYRQKDNKGERWVSEFVEALKTELESTFKEEISVYFDINPHDGLLETHDVDASLKEKLKCLVFIPIISRTYCDTKSFAWEHEFKSFVEQASQDQFGLKVKLPNSNVASRVLPIRIHDLDTEDMKLFGGVTGSAMRTLDFVFKTTSGVNRPLKAKEDHPNDNLNKTYYQDQINKVSLAIKEIISALGQHIPQKEEVPKEVFKPISVPQKSNKTKIIAGLVIGLALVILGYFLIPKSYKPKEQLEKSIAVLPFINDSPDQENAYFINGIMDEVLNNLQKIKNFRVLSRTSTEQFRGSSIPTIPEIAKKLGVNYIVEGSGQKYGNEFRVRVQLIAANNEKHLWAESYEKEIRETKDIFDTQSEIAQSIALAMKTTITPEEEQLINKVSTANLTAYDFFQKGREELGKFPFHDLIVSSTTYPIFFDNQSNKKSIDKAKLYYRTALRYDSSFALAYAELAALYWSENYFKEYFSKNYLDSVLFLANKALSFDDRLPDAYYIRAMYFGETGNIKQARADFDKTLQLNPNYWLAYYGKGSLYLEEYIDADYTLAIKNFKEAASRYHGSALPYLLKRTAYALSISGFNELASDYRLKAARLEMDSSEYFFSLFEINAYAGNVYKGFEFLQKAYSRDSTNILTLWRLAGAYSGIGESRESLIYFKKYLKRVKELGITMVNDIQRIGVVYSDLGFKDSAEYYFKKQIENCNVAIRLGRPYGISFAYYDLALIYASGGDKIRALENLNIFKNREGMCSWFATALQNDPAFHNFRNDPDFQKIFLEIEVKYQAEHERVRKWLEEQGML